MGNAQSVGSIVDQCLRTDQPPLRGVFHAAGVMQYKSLGNQTPEQMQEILAAKMVGGWLLHRLLGGCSFGTFRIVLVVVVSFEFADDGQLRCRQRFPGHPCSSSPSDRESSAQY
jgi:KR domain